MPKAHSIYAGCGGGYRRILQHITDPTSIHLGAGEAVSGVQIEATGTPVGRVLFQQWAPLIEVTGKGARVSNASLIGGTVGILIRGSGHQVRDMRYES